MDRKTKRLKRHNGDFDYLKAKDWGEKKASLHLYAYSEDKQDYHKKAVTNSIEAMKNYGTNKDIKETKNGVELTDKRRKFFRVASTNMKRTLNTYEKNGTIPAYADIIHDYLSKHPEGLRYVSKPPRIKHKKA